MVISLVDPLSPTDAVCLDPALFAYTAVRDAEVKLGDRVVISGLGAIGLFVVQMLKRAGCMAIIAIDPLPARRALAERFGATLTLDPTAVDVGLAVHEHLDGCGADVAIEGSGNYQGLAAALRSVRQCGRIVTFGYYKGRDSQLELGAEWHHNRLELRSSMPDWNCPNREHPLWDRPRLARTVLQMFQERMLSSTGIVHPIVPFAEADQAFMAAYREPAGAVKLGVKVTAAT